jgi:very-short-patch-repair endonuclease
MRSDRADLRRLGVKVIEYREVFDMLPTGGEAAPRSLQPPGERFINWLKSTSPVAVLGVPLNNVADLQICYGYLVEPAFRNDLSLWIYATESFPELAEQNYLDVQLGFSWTLERLQYLTKMFGVVEAVDGLPPMTPIEEALYSRLSERGWSPQPQYGIKRYTADFAFPPFRIVVECDGRGFHDKAKDRRRDAHLQRLGWTTHRFTGTEIWYDPDGVVDKIEATLDTARQLAEQAPTLPLEVDLPDNPGISIDSSATWNSSRTSGLPGCRPRTSVS